MRFAHVSDLHMDVHGVASPDHGLTANNVTSAIAQDLTAISDALDLIVISGDLTERADAETFAAFEQMLGDIGLPLIVVPGNHDGPAGMHAYSAFSEKFASWDITNRVVEIAGARFLGLDTCIEDVTEGALEDEGLALLADEIARDADSSLVSVMHHPPLVLGLQRFDGFCRLDGRERLMKILGAAQDRVIILSGHVHRPYTAVEGRISCHIAGSIIAPYDSALPFGDFPIRPTTLQDFYFVHDLKPGGSHVVTAQRVRGLVP